MTGGTFPGQKTMRHAFKQVVGFCRKSGGGFLIGRINGSTATFPATDAAGKAVSQIGTASATYTLLEAASVPAGAKCVLDRLRFFQTGAAFKTVYVFTFVALTITITPGIGSTWTNNGKTFTVTATNITGGGGTVTATGTGAPLASGTLTKASGTGDATDDYASVVTTTGTITIQYSDGTLIGTVALATAFPSTTQVVDFTQNSTGVTMSSTGAINPRNVPAGCGIQAVVVNAGTGAAGAVLDIALDWSVVV